MSQTNPPSSDPEECSPSEPLPAGFSSCELLIINRKGLHARATAKLVQCIEPFNAEVLVSRCNETVGGTSIMGILTLGAGPGSTIRIAAKGPDAADVLAAVTKLVGDRFGEDE
ncbi:MAG: HPr family phosphocarrier protein [Methylovirgula sp.]